ncbi:16S rRNA (uracil(1498)-N(3))-methyltransferase [Helicobacter brantae]|uniref:Ribosomal RNA small subunit methyltransferase E n=1 Tax=Helicobacter brantae TaxID=375927 RepID=A0A3D8IV79_9HELI|nr:16S rRNA (uracil(1498)-N(3))-methyltransferase [Helicobacter brantae]RDU69187.1 16S rRNA (uracil(1498)-N(3))-methyltransferase [Helicobacter brantae]
MQFSFHPQAGNLTLSIEGELYTHLYKSRRTKNTQTLAFRNLIDEYLYFYTQEKIDRKSATLKLTNKEYLPLLSQSQAHIILSIIEGKTLQKLLPFLNELGVQKLTLFYADYSQRNERVDLDKLTKILINSSQQCGRSNTIKLEILDNLLEVLKLYPQVGVFDFGGEKLEKTSLPILIGAEGGFSPKEREILKNFPKYSTKENLILRSESACVYVASILL